MIMTKNYVNGLWHRLITQPEGMNPKESFDLLLKGKHRLRRCVVIVVHDALCLAEWLTGLPGGYPCPMFDSARQVV